MKIEKDLIIEKQDLDWILSRYVRSYLFYSKNKSPESIVFPMIPAVKNIMSPSGAMIPVKFVPFVPDIVTPQEALELPDKVEEIEEKPSDIAGQLGAPRNRRTPKAVSSSIEDEPQLHKKE